MSRRALAEVTVTEHPYTLQLDAETACLMVTGSKWRMFVDELEGHRRADLQYEFGQEAARRRIDSVDATTLIARGVRPGATTGAGWG